MTWASCMQGHKTCDIHQRHAMGSSSYRTIAACYVATQYTVASLAHEQIVCVCVIFSCTPCQENCYGILRKIELYGSNWLVCGLKQDVEKQSVRLVCIGACEESSTTELHVTFDSTRATELSAPPVTRLTSTDVVFMLQGTSKESKFGGGGIP